MAKPRPIYFHPFMDSRHYIGAGGHSLGDLPSAVSLHLISPTFTMARAKYLTLGSMEEKRQVRGQDYKPFLDYSTADHRIYVLGHGSSGSNTLTTETTHGNGGRQAMTCTSGQLAHYLIRFGLPLASRAHIRIHACNSASPRLPGNHSFCRRFYDEMHDGQNYMNLTVRGYDTGVGAYFFRRLGGSLTGSANAYMKEWPTVPLHP